MPKGKLILHPKSAPFFLPNEEGIPPYLTLFCLLLARRRRELLRIGSDEQGKIAAELVLTYGSVLLWIYLTSILGPFFPGYDRFRINWSKLPWIRFQEMSAAEMSEAFAAIRKDMQSFCRSVARIGYNGVTLDDVPHLALHEFYEEPINGRIALYQKEFRELFQTIRAEGLQVYLTMDILTLTPGLEARLGNNERRQRQFLISLLDRFFVDFPEVAGSS